MISPALRYMQKKLRNNNPIFIILAVAKLKKMSINDPKPPPIEQPDPTEGSGVTTTVVPVEVE